MPPTITLGFSYHDGDRVSPDSLHRLVEEATISGISPGDLALSAGTGFFTYGNTRPTLARGTVHYDTTAGLEGLVYSFFSASNGSVAGWLSALPHRSCYCWANSAVSAGTPVFAGNPGAAADPDFTLFDGSFFPNVWQFSGASGPNASFFLTLESVTNNRPVLCMWAGLVPQFLQTLNAFTPSASRASIAAPVFVDFTGGGAFKFGTPTARNFIFGVSLENNATGLGSVIWGTGPCAEDLS